MPDHAHLLIEIPETTSLQKFIRQFKQLSGFRLKQRTGNPAWQISYYDRVLRKEEEIGAVAEYIWYNAVKEGLAEDTLAYPWSGPRASMEDERG
jgi:REP element-mobilizing transposase RayT